MSGRRVSLSVYRQKKVQARGTRKGFKVGDRVTWSPRDNPVGDKDWSKMGVVVRLDVVWGQVIQYVVFNDYGEYVVVTKKDKVRLRNCPPRMTVSTKQQKFIDSVQVGSLVETIGGQVFVVGCLLPNNMVLPERPENYPEAVPPPRELEYLKKVKGGRIRKHVSLWEEDGSNPYILRMARPDGRPKSRNWGSTTSEKSVEVVEEYEEVESYCTDILRVRVALKRLQLRND